MYTKEFEIRWNDLDANKHLGNSAYIEMMSHTRLSFFKENDLGLEVMKSMELGPIVIYEHIYYFKEVLFGTTLTVSLEVSGFSENGRFVLIHHNFYDKNGKNLAHAEMLFSWINMKTRKLGHVSNELFAKIKAFPRTKSFKILTSNDTRKFGKKPIDLN